MFGRALCLAAGKWAEKNNSSVSAVVLNDSVAPEAYYVNDGFAQYTGAGKNKVKFILNYLRQCLAFRYEWVIFCHVSLSPLATLTKLLNPGAKIAVITYGIEVWQPLSKIQNMALRQADAVFAISDYTRDELIRHTAIPPEKISIFPCTLDPHWEVEPPATRSECKPPVILSVARMQKEDRYKGIDSVIRSLPAVVQKAGPVEYRVIGQGDDVPRLKALAEGLGVARYVHFMGGVSEAELRELYKCCSIFVMPSRKEGFGIVFLEAMAYGKPVIGGAHGGTPSVVKNGETGLLVDSSDLAGIADSIIQLLQDGEMRDSFGRAGYQRLVNEFTFDKFEHNFAEALRSYA